MGVANPQLRICPFLFPILSTMMKKDEMDIHFREYGAKIASAHAAEKHGLFRETIAAAASAWANIDGMLQYASKYNNEEITDISAIELVLKYAPFMLDYKTLNSLEELLRKTKRISRDDRSELPEKLETARRKLRANHRLWSHIQLLGDVRQDELARQLGGEQDYWRWACECWERMRLLRRIPDRNSFRLSFATRMGQIFPGKCPKCGDIVKAPKAMLLESTRCAQCHANVQFVLLPTDGAAALE
jgi:hypothetical protein